MTTQRFCANCGTALQPEERFCGVCGTDANAVAPAPAAAQSGLAGISSANKLILGVAALAIAGAAAFFLLGKDSDDQAGAIGGPGGVAAPTGSPTVVPAGTSAPSVLPSQFVNVSGCPDVIGDGAGGATRVGDRISLGSPPLGWVSQNVQRGPLPGVTTGIRLAHSQADLDLTLPRDSRISVYALDPNSARNAEQWLIDTGISFFSYCRSEGPTLVTIQGSVVQSDGVYSEYVAFYDKAKAGKGGLIVLERPEGNSGDWVIPYVTLRIDLKLE